MRHREAFRRLPDLLDDRDDTELLDHLRACAACQRQLFLLGRIDRALRDGAAVRKPPRGRRLLAATAAVTAAAAAVFLLTLFAPASSRRHPQRFALRTAAGRLVGEATIAQADAHNVSLALTAHDLPVRHGRGFVLWAGDRRSTMQVGRFLADTQGRCRVRFNLPANHDWSRLWVTRPGNTHTMVATGV